MLNRRQFARVAAASLVYSGARGMGLVRHRTTGVKTSVMMWTLNKYGSFEQNLQRVAQAGYSQVELVNEYKPWSEEDRRRILGRMRQFGISVDAMAGMTRGFAEPGGGDAFLAELQSLIPIAKQLGCRQIILLSGTRVESVAPAGAGVVAHPDQHAMSIETLRRAGQVLGEAGITGVIEPIDRLENPHIYLDGVTEAFAIVKAVDSPSIRVLYDLYHEQRSQGNLIEKIETNLALIGLFHVADVPGRHEPGTGEMNYGNIYRRLAQLGYKGTIAMEFYPTGDPVATLRVARKALLRYFGMAGRA